MQRLIFEPEHEQFRDGVRRFFQREIAPHGERWREQGYVDREAYLKAGKLGYLLMWADEAYGGAGVKDFRYEQIVYEENIRNGELGFYINLHSGLVAPYIGGLGSEAQKQRFLPKCISGETILAVAISEPGAGSDIGGIRSHAEDKGDHWLLNGSKTYISNGQLADLVIVVARTVPDKRSGLGLFIVEAGMPGFERGRRLKKMGMSAQDTSELFFHDVKVPKDNVLGDPTQAFAYLARFLSCERLIASVGSMAAAQTAFDLTLDYVRERRAFGRPIGAFQNTRFVMADLRTQLDVAQTFIDQCVLLYNADRLTAEVAAEAKLFSSEVEGRVTDACVQLHGGAGYMEEYRISRMFTDARVTRIFAGSSEIMKEIISRSIGLDDRKMN
ncbi:acyl-CoA dehydrogenase family protein [Chelatococcus asaccharovorans]|uniref:Acyl-CoA dehydrogenase n=1 Tax=Chelatococcus asaccharovorans TaxID=28210 RepID=A0A2V3UK74_9HYPH|nr:acyl-CoA dehydrogenase family protein [Chelatococcus asaccharovorans]MBS7706207.1 acyl-CoA dehydrogenase family protein [Chelatococcus asaccharovorans]PXW65160.1 acyl-CoA dehydrogenase [Chelatococcus asaccharovorans]